MICNQNHTIGEIAFDSSVWCLSYLILDAIVTGDVDFARGPPLGHGHDEKGHALLGKCHVSVIVILFDQIQWCTDVLRDGQAKEENSVLGWYIGFARVQDVHDDAGPEIHP